MAPTNPMAPTNVRPVRRASLLVALALLGSLVVAAISLGSAGGNRAACLSAAHHNHSFSTSRARRAACVPRRHIGRAHAIPRHSKGPVAEAPSTPPGNGVVQPAPMKPTVQPPAETPTTEAPTESPPATNPSTEPSPSPEPEPSPEPPSPSPNPSPTPEPEPAPATHSIYWGAWIKNSAGEAPWSMSAASQFEQLAGKPVSLINWSSPFSLSNCNGYCAFQTSEFNAVRSHGAIPFFSWNPGPGTGSFTDAQVAAGAQDSYIRAWAQAAKNWGHPLFLRFAWEMNGSWFPWGVGNNGTTAADYVAMWRHVHDIFTSVGATNVTWVWCPNIDPYGARTPMSSVYPGNAYVDWTCLDGYNGDNPWTSFSGLFKSSYEAITGSIAPSKPMIVGETASTEAGGSKAQWIDNLLGNLPTEFPKIRGLLWFNKVESGPGGHSDWPLESSVTASNAFAAGIKNPDYVGNAFGNLNTSPIPTP